MQRLIDTIKEIFGFSPTFGAARSPQWSAVRNAYLKQNPTCAVCGKTRGAQVHHARPFHLHPELELDPTNFITLCQGLLTGNHHILFGHLGNWSSFNETVREDAKYFNEKIKTRP